MLACCLLASNLPQALNLREVKPAVAQNDISESLHSSDGLIQRYLDEIRNNRSLSMCVNGNVWEGGDGEELEVRRAADYTGAGRSSSSCSSIRQT